jgi:glycosyltransferase involved in cell wall biosynthesis
VFVTFREGLSVALMEAMGSGSAIACTRIRGNTDLIENDVNGLFTDNNPDALGETILKMYRDPQMRQRLGAAAAEKAMLYDESTIHRQMKEIYLSM